MTAPADLDSLSGLDVMRLIAGGELPPPPIAKLLGMEIEEVGDGYAAFTLEPDDRMLNPIGSIHGGIAATLLDSCMGCAVHTTLPPSAGYTTAQLNLHYLRSMQPGMGSVRAIGTVLHRGRTQSTAEAKLLDADGRLLAHGTTTCLILTGLRPSPTRHGVVVASVGRLRSAGDGGRWPPCCGPLGGGGWLL